MSAEPPEKRPLWCCSRCDAVYRKDYPFCPADGGEVIHSDTDPLIGKALDHYVVDSLIGEGAMGRVYRAHHKLLTDRSYALKVLIGDLSSTQEMRMRFVNEAKTASRLSHPNVVTVIDVGRSPKGLLYLVMELVDGTPLADLIDQPMDPIRAAKIIRGVCQGLAHAHAKGLVHRDLKPENILIVAGPDGELPRIVDFGIAVQLERTDVRLTATGMTMGTPAYVAPEQVQGLRVDGRADQYSVGVSLFEMLTGGKLPFDGAPMEVVTKKARDDAPSLDERMPASAIAPPALVRLVDRMISRRPADRFDSINDIARMLTRWLEAPSTEVLDLGHSRRRKFALAAVAGVVLLGAGAATWALRDHGDASAAARANAVAAPPPAIDAAAVVAITSEPVAPAADRSAAVDPAPVDATPTATEAAPTLERDRRSDHRRSHKQRARDRRTKPGGAEVTPSAPPTVPPPPRPPPSITPPVASSTLSAELLGIDVSGALSRADVRRAIDRIAPAIRRCTTTTPHTAQVRFTIDDSRRARAVRGSGAPSPALACLTAAFGGVRTESAPDVGDAEVVVRVAFRGPS